MTVFRASSLAAVTILVWSTRPKPRLMAHSRAACRTRTTSSSLRTGTCSSLTTAMAGFALIAGALEKLHSALDVEGGAHARQGQAQLHERDGYRRPHPRHHRVRIQDAGHGRDVAEYAPDEGVHEIEGGDVDEHALRLVAADLLHEVVLQRHGQSVVHVHLDGHQEVRAHLEDRDPFHGPSSGPAGSGRHL